MPISFSRFRLAASAVSLIWVIGGCGDSTGLPPATVANVIDTVIVYALQDTPLTTPSAFDIVNARAARTDKGEIFDLAFDINAENENLIMPAGALNLQPEAGILSTEKAFSEIVRAPEDDYEVMDPLPVSVGDVFVGRSRRSSNFCGYLGSLPRYAKFQVLAIDVDQRSVTLEFLANVNCGYRSLEPGLPTF